MNNELGRTSGGRGHLQGLAPAIHRRCRNMLAAIAGAALALFGVLAHAQFTVTTVDSTGDVGGWSSLQLNGAGNPVVAYWDQTNTDLKLATCTANCFTPTPTWQIVTVDASANNVGLYASLQLNGAGNPVITYWEATDNDLKMATCTAGCASATPTWQIVVVDGGGGETNSLAFNGAGNPVVSYYGGNNSPYSLRLATCTANCASAAPTWQIVTVDATSTNTGLNSSLAFNAAGNPVIAYRDYLAANRDLRLATCTANCTSAAPTWQLVTVDGSGDVGDTLSLALTVAGNPVISYRDATNNQLKLATCTAGCATATPTFQIVNVAAGPYWSSLKLTGAGNPVVSYAGTAPDGIKVATCTGGCATAAPTWTFQTVFLTSSGNESSLQLTSTGTPVLTFQEGNGRDLLWAFGPVAPPVPPVVVSINRVGPATVPPSTSQQFTVTFSAAVTGVDAGDFVLTTTGAIAGASITGVSGSGATWTVTINVGGPSGTVRLDVVDNDSIVDGASTPLGGAGNGNGSFNTGEFYSVQTPPPPPVVVSINRVGPATVPPSTSQQFTVTFSKPVTGVDAGDFVLTTTGAIAGASITGVSGSGATWAVTVNVGGPSGTVRLDVVDNDSIVDGASTPLGGAGAGNGSFNTGQFYTVQAPPPPPPPVVLSINRVGPATVPPSTSQQFTVTFSKPVTGVDAGDFVLTTTGAIAGASITGVSGSGATWTVTINVGGPSGTVRLDVVDNDSIVDGASTPLGGAGAGNGSFNTGEFYTVQAASTPPPPSAAIPTLSEWTLALLVMLLAAVGAHMLRRRG